MRLPILVIQTALLASGLFLAVLWAMGQHQFIIYLLYILSMVGLTNYIGSTILKFSRIKDKYWINIHWIGSTAYLLTAVLLIFFNVDFSPTVTMVLILALPWLFPVLFWYILFQFYKLKR